MKRNFLFLIILIVCVCNEVYSQDYEREKKHIAKCIKKNFTDVKIISPNQIDVIDATARMMKGMLTTSHTYWLALIDNRAFVCESYHPKSLSWKRIDDCIEVACYKDDMCEFCSQGIYSFNEKSYEKSVKLFKTAANHNHKVAQHWLGYYHQTIEYDTVQAKYWYKKAANQNFARSQFQLGDLYGIEKDYKTSLEWFEKAAKNGYVMGQLMMGLYYGFGNDYGWEIEENKKEAIYWLTIAVEQGMNKQDKIDSGNDSKLVEEYFKMAKRLLYKLENE